MVAQKFAELRGSRHQPPDVQVSAAGKDSVRNGRWNSHAVRGPIGLQNGIDRVSALLAKATSLSQIITLESELTRRQADLDSLTQRLAELDKITTTSDVTLTLCDPRFESDANSFACAPGWARRWPVESSKFVTRSGWWTW